MRALGVLLLLLLVNAVVSVGAQLPPIGVQKLQPNLFLITGGNANTLMFVMSKGVALIDTKGPRAGWGRRVADQVTELTPLPITTIINTHVHGDHVGGNVDFEGEKIEIIAHENAAADMRRMTMMFPKPTGGGLPTRTFKDRLTVGSGPDRIDLYYFGAGHTRSDIFVVIPALRVLHTGDAFPGKFLPALDRVNGGNGVDYPQTLTMAIPLTRDIDMIITGHGGIAKPRELAIHADFMRDFLKSAKQAKKAGLTPAAAAKAWTMPTKYVGYEARQELVLGSMEWIFRQLP